MNESNKSLKRDFSGPCTEKTGGTDYKRPVYTIGGILFTSVSLYSCTYCVIETVVVAEENSNRETEFK